MVLQIFSGNTVKPEKVYERARQRYAGAQVQERRQYRFPFLMRCANLLGVFPGVVSGDRLRLRRCYIYQYTLLLVNTAIRIAHYYIKDGPPGDSYMSTTITSKAALVLAHTLSQISHIAGTITGVARVECLIACGDQLDQVMFKLSNGRTKTIKSRYDTFMKITAVYLLVLCVAEVYMMLTINSSKGYISIAMAIVIVADAYGNYIMGMEFNMLTQRCASAFELANVILNDSMRDIDSEETGPRRKRAQSVAESVTWSYHQLRMVVTRINDSYGVLMGFMVMEKCAELTCTLYQCRYRKLDGVATFIVQINWAIFHIIDMVFITEPAQHILKEVNKTVPRIGTWLSRLSSYYDPLAQELIALLDIVTMDKLHFTLMGIVVLNTGLVVTMVGLCTSLLLLIFQFGEID